jgi:hypothetical protein
MRVAALRVRGRADLWRDLGFEVAGDRIPVANCAIELDPDPRRAAIESWALDAERVPSSIDGLRTEPGARTTGTVNHPNGALSVDHLVVATSSLERTARAFAEIGVECRRVREAGNGIRQGFFLLSDFLVEVVESAEVPRESPARFWGLTVAVEDIDRTASLLGARLGRVKDAVQPGRRIATVRPEASGELPLAFITQRPPRAG